MKKKSIFLVVIVSILVMSIPLTTYGKEEEKTRMSQTLLDENSDKDGKIQRLGNFLISKYDSLLTESENSEEVKITGIEHDEKVGIIQYYINNIKDYTEQEKVEIIISLYAQAKELAEK